MRSTTGPAASYPTACGCGLYQTGSCTAPGGGISGLPGRNAAEAILKHQDRDLNQVVAAVTR